MGQHHGFAARGTYDKRLAEFFEKEISDEDRDWLLGLPGEEMQQQLQRLFLTRTRPAGRPGSHRPDEPVGAGGGMRHQPIWHAACR